MNTHYWVIALGAFMVLMGIVGYIRTGSPTAIFITGGIALITSLLGVFWGKNPASMFGTITLAWTALITVLMAYMTFKRISAHADTTAGSEFIFGSMAVFALIVTIVILRQRLAG